MEIEKNLTGEITVKKARGGKRPGSGRKKSPTGRNQQYYFTFSPEILQKHGGIKNIRAIIRSIVK